MTRFCLMFAALLASLWTPLAAHTSPNTEIRLEPSDDALTARITVPVSDYTSATGNSIGEGAASLEQATQEVSSRFSLTSQGGSQWSLKVDNVEFTSGTGPADLNATVIARPAPGASTETVTLRWDMFPANAPGHIAMVMISDNAVVDQDAIQGALTSRSKALTLELDGVVKAVEAVQEPSVQAAAATPSEGNGWLPIALIMAALFGLAALAGVMRLRSRSENTSGS